MLTLKQIEAAILQLSPEEFRHLSEWFFDLDYQRWDEQLEKDIADGKLEDLAQEAIAGFEAGHLSGNLMHYTTRRFWECYNLRSH